MVPLTFRSEGIPHSIFCFHCGTTRFRGWRLDADSLFSVNCNTGSGIECDQGVFLATSHENTLVAMGFDDYLGATLHSTPSSTAATTTATE
jgi:hypothetical protein